MQLGRYKFVDSLRVYKITSSSASARRDTIVAQLDHTIWRRIPGVAYTLVHIVTSLKQQNDAKDSRLWFIYNILRTGF